MAEPASTRTHHFPVEKSEAEWRAQLTPEQYYILREHGTERAGTCALNTEKRRGTFYCVGCDQPLGGALQPLRRPFGPCLR
jgi:peptide-methionine (R)-S-oxide reductase